MIQTKSPAGPAGLFVFRARVRRGDLAAAPLVLSANLVGNAIQVQRRAPHQVRDGLDGVVEAIQVPVAQVVVEAIAAQKVGDGAESVAGGQEAVALVVGNTGEGVHGSPPAVL